MCAALNRAVLTISVDLECDAAEARLAQRSTPEAMADRLLEIFARYEVPATWALDEPTIAPVAARIVSRYAGHEIALSGTAGCAGDEAGQASFGRELAHRAATARAAGWDASTLVLVGGDLGEHAELARKHGITAVRHAVTGGTSQPRMQPRTLRFGLWSFPVACELPGNRRWQPGGGGGRAVGRSIERAIAERGLVQLAIDARRLAARGFAAQRVLDRVLAHAVRYRQQGVIDIATIGETAARLSTRCESVPSRSILRPAA